MMKKILLLLLSGLLLSCGATKQDEAIVQDIPATQGIQDEQTPQELNSETFVTGAIDESPILDEDKLYSADSEPVGAVLVENYDATPNVIEVMHSFD